MQDHLNSMDEMSRRNKKNDDKVILLLDVDCFSVQILLQEFPKYKNCPTAHLNADKLATVSYEARSFGITKKMTPEEAKILCPDLYIFEHDLDSEDLDPLKNSRFASWNIMTVIREYVFNELKLSEYNIEKGSPDEFYLDLTSAAISRSQQEENSSQLDKQQDDPPIIYMEDKYNSSMLTSEHFSKNYESQLLVYGGVIAQELCQKLWNDERTKFKCSGGVSHNKLLAKLACGLHRPNSITILPQCGIDRVSSIIKIENLPGLGGKIGELLKQEFNILTMKDLQSLSFHKIKEFHGEKLAVKINKLAYGICDSQVSPTKLSTDLVCRKRMEESLVPFDDIVGTIRLLSKRMAGRLQEEKDRNHRKPLNLKLSIKTGRMGGGGTGGGVAELSLPSNYLSWEELLQSALEQLNSIYDEKNTELIKEISLYVKNFSPSPSSSCFS